MPKKIEAYPLIQKKETKKKSTRLTTSTIHGKSNIQKIPRISRKPETQNKPTLFTSHTWQQLKTEEGKK